MSAMNEFDRLHYPASPRKGASSQPPWVKLTVLTNRHWTRQCPEYVAATVRSNSWSAWLPQCTAMPGILGLLRTRRCPKDAAAEVYGRLRTRRFLEDGDVQAQGRQWLLQRPECTDATIRNSIRRIWRRLVDPVISGWVYDELVFELGWAASWWWRNYADTLFQIPETGPKRVPKILAVCLCTEKWSFNGPKMY